MDALVHHQSPSQEAATASLAPEERSGLLSGTGSLPRAAHALSALRLVLLLLTLALFSQFFAVVPAGHEGVLLRFGAVQPQVLHEGIHPILPGRDRLMPMTLRLQSQRFGSEAATRDLQDVGFDVAVTWHLQPGQGARAYQRLGERAVIVSGVIEPAVEDGLKAVVASFRAEELITQRQLVKEALRQGLAERLSAQDLELDAVDLLQVAFSEPFRQAVEAKQVAEQEARRAEYEAMKAQRRAQARVFEAEGEARAQQLLQSSLTPEVLEHEAIDKWNGHLPLVVGHDNLALDVKSLLKAEQRRSQPERRR
ncbi:MAG: prohibitin family protein [Cyanobacteriota bacterium]|nr:prohibitin family protein [Cyanobacteriota bacterium]